MVLFVVQTILRVMNTLLNLIKNVMCTNKRWIRNKYNGKDYFVKCGSCPACLQEKAGKRAYRIVNNFNIDKGYICLFAHFTYANDCLPYLRWSDIIKYRDFTPSEQKNYEVVKTIRGKEKKFYLLPLYRDSINRRIRFSTTWKTEKHRLSTPRREIDRIPIESSVIKHLNIWENGYCKPTNHSDVESLSVIYYKDFVNYIKRLRSYVTYHSEIFTNSSERSFEYFFCGEYGENYCRSHIHALFWVKSDCFEKWRHALAENWLFDDCSLTFRNIEIAKKPASYVSTYVTGNLSLPVLLQQPAITQKWSMSQHFGFGNHLFQFHEVLASIRKGFACYDSKYLGKDGVYSTKSIPLPSYVLRYYFPKFKGYYRLSIHAQYNIFENPSRLGEYASICGYSSKIEVQKDIKYLINKRNQFYKLVYDEKPLLLPCEHSLLSPKFSDTFAYWCINAHSARVRSQFFEFFENQTDPLSIIYSYDNFADTFDKVEHQSFEFLDMLNFECDPNRYPSNLSSTEIFTQKYYDCDKSHKVKNKVYGKYKQKSESPSVL